MLILVISHNIFLNEEQVVSLLNRNSVEVVGTCCPVWFNKGNTTEPGNEIFVKYTITNEDKDYPVTKLKNGFKINLPQIKNEEMEFLNPDKLLPKEFGGEELLIFKRYSKVKDNNKRINEIHTFEIKSLECLEKTIFMGNL